MDGACFVVGKVARDKSFQGGEGTRVEVGFCEDLGEIGGGVWEFTMGGVFFL